LCPKGDRLSSMKPTIVGKAQLGVCPVPDNLYIVI
jgi:hypothetical protein